jgi:hypothetical protein
MRARRGLTAIGRTEKLFPASMARAWHNIMPMKIAMLIARFKLEMEKLFIRPRKERDLIKQDLYWNQYRYRSKSDDDLPIRRDTVCFGS